MLIKLHTSEEVAIIISKQFHDYLKSKICSFFASNSMFFNGILISLCCLMILVLKLLIFRLSYLVLSHLIQYPIQDLVVVFLADDILNKLHRKLSRHREFLRGNEALQQNLNRHVNVIIADNIPQVQLGIRLPLRNNH